MVDADFAKCASMSVQFKDLNNALDTASTLGFDAPITALFAPLYGGGVEHGLADLDHSALFLELTRRNAEQTLPDPSTARASDGPSPSACRRREVPEKGCEAQG